MNTNRRHQYEMIILIDLLTESCPYYNGYEEFCEECSTLFNTHYRVWHCYGCDAIYGLPWGITSINERSLEAARRRARHIKPKPDHHETNTQLAKRHGITKRQASKVRQLLR